MTIVAALLCKNEAAKDLKLVLDRLTQTSDQILVLDDQSTDDSVAVARGCGATVRVRGGEAMWGREAPARAELWDWGSEVAKDGWLLIADCDMLLEGDPRPYSQSEFVNTWSFILYDMWGPNVYRADGYWRGHRTPRPWLFRPSGVPDGWMPQWPDRGIHPGHLPMNWPGIGGWAQDLAWRHLAYSTPERRLQKHAQYLSQSAHLSPDELAHAASILDT